MHIQKTRLFKSLVALAVSILIITLLKNNSAYIRRSFLDIASLTLRSLNAASSITKKIIPFASLRGENRALKARIDYLSRKALEMKSVSSENERLKDLLDFKKELPYAVIPAQVIGRDPSNWSNSLILNKGSNHGICQNKAVLSPKGLVGRIVEVGRYSAKVLLITDPNSKVGVVIQRNRHGAILAGRPDGKCKMIYIPLDSDVAPGDKVITAGLSSIYPKDLLVGEVLKAGREPGRLYKYAIVRPAEEMSGLEEVLCAR